MSLWTLKKRAALRYRNISGKKRGEKEKLPSKKKLNCHDWEGDLRKKKGGARGIGLMKRTAGTAKDDQAYDDQKVRKEGKGTENAVERIPRKKKEERDAK